VIHIDTGMHRLGFSPEEAQVLANDAAPARAAGLRC
jgi:alanine racemase